LSSDIPTIVSEQGEQAGSDVAYDTDVEACLTSEDFMKMFESTDKTEVCEFMMRNFTQVLTALAKEQSLYEELGKKTNTQYGDIYRDNIKTDIIDGKQVDNSTIVFHAADQQYPAYAYLRTYYATPTTDGVNKYNPHSEIVLPILMLKGFPPMNGYALNKLIEVDHEGASYYIGDLVDENNPEVDIDYNDNYFKSKKYVGYHDYKPSKFSNRSVFSVLSSLFNQVAADPKNLPTQQIIQVQ
jgi:hypothetical protein